MKRKFIKYTFLALIAIVAIAFVIGYQIWNKPHQNIMDAASVKTTAIALYDGLAGDSAIMKSTFLNKVVMVSGEVKDVSENQQNQQVILLRTNIPDGSVNCTMEKNAGDIRLGEMVVIKGLCIGYTAGDMGIPGDVFLIRCYRTT